MSKALEGTNIEEIKEKTETLTNEFHTISAKMYEQAQAAQGAGPDMGGFDPNNMAGGGAQDNTAPPHDNVVDADYEVVDDKEKK